MNKSSIIRISETKTAALRPPVLLAATVLLALVLRMVFLFQIRTTPLFHFLAADTGDFERFAVEILDGNILNRETIYFNPLYPFFLSAIYFIFGHRPFLALIVQGVLDGGVCLILYFLAARIFRDGWTGLLAAVIYAGYGLAIFYTGIMVGATLATFLFILSAGAALFAGDSGKRWPWLPLGFIFGCCALLRPNTLIVLPCILLWSLLRGKGQLKSGTRLLRPLVLLGGFFLAVGPFSYRNYLITGDITLPFGNGGFNFHVGNHRGALGTYTYLEGISHTPAGQIKSSVKQVKKVTGEEVSISQASNYWFGRSWIFIRERPLEFLRLLGRKFLLFWNAREVAQNIDYYFSRRFSRLISLPLFSFGLIAPFSWIGFAFAWRKKPETVILPAIYLSAYMFSLIAIFISDRYRLPAVPFIVLFSAYGLRNLAKLIFPRPSREIRVYAAVGIAAFILVNVDLKPVDETKALSWSHTMLGNVYQEQGQPEAAIREFGQAIAINPADTSAYNALGSAYRSLGRYREAISQYRRVLENDPRDATARNNLGVVYAEMGMTDEALAEFQAAIQVDPAFGEAHSNLAVYYLYHGNDPRLARFHAEQARAYGYQIPAPLAADLMIFPGDFSR